MHRIVLSACLGVLLIVPAVLAQPRTSLVSPKVDADGKVTFALRAPRAEKVIRVGTWPAERPVMNTSLVRGLGLALAWLAAGGTLHAHPGHDGHELTWDLGHLMAHPWPTAGGLALVVLAVLAARRLRQVDGGAEAAKGMRRVGAASRRG